MWAWLYLGSVSWMLGSRQIRDGKLRGEFRGMRFAPQCWSTGDQFVEVVLGDSEFRDQAVSSTFQ